MVPLLSTSLSGSQSLLPAVRLRPPGLRWEAHSHGYDEGHPGDSVVEVHGLSSSRLHHQHHQTDQQSLHAARRRGSRLPGHALHPTSSEHQRRNNGQPNLKATDANHTPVLFFPFKYYFDIPKKKHMNKCL